MDFEQKNVVNIYSKISDHFNNTRHYTWKWVEDFLDTCEGKIVADVGCGNGRNMKRDNINFFGVDNCPEFVDICKNQSLNVMQSDMCFLPFSNNMFDSIISIAAFHHLYSLKRRNLCLQEFRRILKPEGRCMISVWSKNQPIKTKRVFNSFGNNLVPWKDKNGNTFNRFYYIFEINEIKELFKNNYFKIIDHKWECGNEIFILQVIK